MSTAPRFPIPQPPDWMMREVHQRIVLLLNHVLQQEPEAITRLKRQKGQVAHVLSAFIAIKFIVTPAGLLDLAEPQAAPELTLEVLETNPLSLLQTLLSGNKPRMAISGDVMLASEINWLVDHVRWDAEEDLSRILGDVPAHTLMRMLRGVGESLKSFIAAAAPKNKSEESSAP
jgi:ubiquinone biosynthesis accessory factor UbiJ